MDKKSITDKWAPIIENIGATQSNEWLSEYKEQHLSNGKILMSVDPFNDVSLLPISMKIAAKTVGLDLVRVKPMGGGATKEEIKEVKRRIVASNRDKKIDAVINDGDFIPKKLEDEPEYKEVTSRGGSKMPLMYIDYKYGGSDDKKI